MSVGQFVPAVSAADVAADIAAAIAAYEATDLGVRPIQTFTRTLLDNKANEAMAPSITFPTGTLGASGAWSLTRNGVKAIGNWVARMDLNDGEILMEGLTSVDLGATVKFLEDFGAGTNNATYTTTATGFDAVLVLEVWKLW